MDAVDLSVVWWAIAVSTLPGFLLGWVSGLRLPWAVAASVPLSYSVYGLSGWLLGLSPWEFTPLSVALCWLIALALAAAWRAVVFAVGRRRRRQAGEAAPTRAGPRQWLRDLGPGVLPFLGVAGAASWLIWRSMTWLAATPGGARNIFQGWDVQWHASVVRWILETGVASPTRAGELQHIELHDPLYYPVAFHAGAALVAELGDAHPIAALNAISIVLPSLGLPLSVALLAWVMVGGRGFVAQIGAGLAAIIAAGVPALYWIGQYVGAWPYLAAIAVSGIVAAVFLRVPGRPVSAFAAAFALTGLTQLHPSAVTIVVLVVALWWLLALVWRPARPDLNPVWARVRDILLLAVTGAAGLLLLLPQVLAGRDQAEEVSDWTTSDSAELGEAWARAFLLDTRHVSDFFPGWDPVVLLVLAGVGALVLMIWRRNFWAPVFYLLSVVMTANALHALEFPGVDLLTVVAGLHYNTAHRLVMPVAMMTAAAAGVGLAAAIRLLTGGPVAALVDRRRGAWRTGSGIAAVLAAVLAGAATLYVVDANTTPGARQAYQTSRTTTRMVDDHDLQAWDWLAQQPLAYDGLIAGEPADGMGWMYAYNGLPSLHRHYQWPGTPRDSATDLTYWNADLLGAGLGDDPDAPNPVDEAAAELGLTYYYLSPGSFWWFQKPRWELLHGLWTSDAVTPVYLDGSVVIFAVNDAFTDAELERVIDSGRRHSPDPVPAVAVPEPSP
ncbi:DUF6541 family protein [Corynebacterium guangdongense]|uniref:Uncharacterized protein n=1 Tax=Corynebacterium guangdongense TaxID=1783348 RepID=A0ABU1ZUE9_9CORY|nr:DUF6541 family protein [Corynebacterium guangdongense]MDR7328551.1 hypothetical protein [Corynebacterium guangdongense]WJZ17128.1 hypothetical protein CGUA_02660 [Corynebacterium guangdongense]